MPSLSKVRFIWKNKGNLNSPNAKASPKELEEGVCDGISLSPTQRGRSWSCQGGVSHPTNRLEVQQTAKCRVRAHCSAQAQLRRETVGETA